MSCLGQARSRATSIRSLLAAYAVLLAASTACTTQQRAAASPWRVSAQLGGRPHEATASRGAGIEVSFAQFSAAVERYQVGVRRDNVSALGSAADAYAAYLLAFHLEYVHHFLATLSPDDAETNAPNLITKVEVVIE